MISAIAKEIELQANYLTNKNLSTLYFGGGTPSLLSTEDFSVIFKAITSVFNVSELLETTIEVNPDDVNLENIHIWKSFGINRISLGVQTFDEQALKFMNRAHSAKQALTALELLKKHDFNNISIDLIYSNNALGHEIGVLNSALSKDIDIISRFELPHISAYSLTIEEKTVFGKWQKINKIKALNDDSSAEQFELLVNSLNKLGYEQYEVSNFALNNQYAIHNTAYWQNHEYLGVGPSAHSYNLHSRQANLSNNSLYIKAIEGNNLSFELEPLSPKDQANDMLLCGLRTIWGVDIKKLSQIAGEFSFAFWDKIDYYKNKNFVSIDNQILTITKQGRIFSDKIASDLFFD
jgi:oxygen-independent coproporphyrinogen III oxidase